MQVSPKRAKAGIKSLCGCAAPVDQNDLLVHAESVGIVG
jgi:hypothetical protein